MRFLVRLGIEISGHTFGHDVIEKVSGQVNLREIPILGFGFRHWNICLSMLVSINSVKYYNIKLPSWCSKIHLELLGQQQESPWYALQEPQTYRHSNMLEYIGAEDIRAHAIHDQALHGQWKVSTAEQAKGDTHSNWNLENLSPSRYLHTLCRQRS